MRERTSSVMVTAAEMLGRIRPKPSVLRTVLTARVISASLTCAGGLLGDEAGGGEEDRRSNGKAEHPVRPMETTLRQHLSAAANLAKSMKTHIATISLLSRRRRETVKR